MENDFRRRKELPIRENNCSRAHSLKIAITKRKVYGGLRTEEKDPKKRLSVEAITDAAHDFINEKLNESPETEKEKNPIRGQKKLKK